MAVFLGNIKGLDVSGSQFTYMVFDSGTGSAPVLYHSTNNIHRTSDVETDDNKIGRILVDNVNYLQTIKNFSFSTIRFDENAVQVTNSNAGWDFHGITLDNIGTINAAVIGGSAIKGTNLTIDDIGTATNFTVTTELVGPIGDWTGTGITIGNSLIAPTCIQSPYFVAISDRRAKTNIKPLSNTLDLIKQTPVYSFNYKASNLPSIGIMAQDVEKYQFDNFKLVDCSSDDVLSIHESKLVYLLWKGIQEQQKQIEELQAELKTLKGGN